MARPESFSSRESAQVNSAAVHHQLRKHKVLPHPQQNDRSWDSRQRTPRTSQPFVSAATSAPLIHDLHQLSSFQDLQHELRRKGTGHDLPPTPPIQSRASSSGHSSRHSIVSARTTSPADTDGGVQLASPATIQRPLATPPDQRSPPTPDVTPPLNRGSQQSYASGVSMRRQTGSPEDTYRPMRHRGLGNNLQKDERDNQAIEDKIVAKSFNAPRAARKMHLRETAALPPPSPERKSVRKPRHAPSAPLKSTKPDSQNTTSVQRTASAPSKPTKFDIQTVIRSRKLSNASPNSISNVVEVLLVDEPRPRQRTLRHVRKHSALRDPLLSDQDLVKEENDLNKPPRPPQTVRKRISDATSRRESCASALSNRTSRSISSNRDRREVLNAGAIPVVIVPERTSSHGHKSRELSLRSISSQRSRRTTSVISAPPRDSQASFERQTRRSRRYSESDHFDWKAFGSPPAIPPRSSSLSAPTSRNVSQASSMKSRSIKTNSFRTEDGRQSQSRPVSPPEPRPQQELLVINLNTHRGEEPLYLDGVEPSFVDVHDLLGLDTLDDTLSFRRLPSFDTPFSVLSMETCATLPELSEALAVHMYHHQNSSILVVDNVGRPSAMQEKKQRSSEPSNSMMDYPTENKSATSTLLKLRLQDAYSPLRNPRVPPQPPSGPPAFNLIPATPSGNTPAHERIARQGNYFESLKERPPRQLDVVKRALSRRRHTLDNASTADKPRGFLTRTFSLSRNTRKGNDGEVDLDKRRNALFPQMDDTPVVEEKLHASWQPQQPSQRQDDVEDTDWLGSLDSDFDAYSYPPVDNRPQRPTRRRRRRRSRSLSAAADFAFPALPAWDYNISDDVFGPESYDASPATGGDLPVLQRRSSAEILERSPRAYRRKQTPPISRQTRGIWRSQSVDTAGRMKRRFSVGEKLEEIQNIPQMIREKRREKRSQKLRLMISGPKEVRDGVGDVIRRGRVEEYRSAIITHI